MKKQNTRMLEYDIAAAIVNISSQRQLELLVWMRKFYFCRTFLHECSCTWIQITLKTVVFHKDYSIIPLNNMI